MNIIIVLNYNDYETTISFLDQVECYATLDKIIIVDNYSTDNSYDFLKKRINDKVDVIQTKENKGYASGNNYGLAFAFEKYEPKNIVISNPDILIEERSITNICSFLNETPQFVAATGLIHNTDEIVVNNFATKLPRYSDLLINNFITLFKLYKSVFNKSIYYNKNKIYSNDILEVEVLPGCFFIIKGDVFKEVGFFDERTFLYGEENILSYKLKNKNYKSLVFVNEKIIHFQGVTINKSIKSWKKKNKIIEDSKLVYLRSYLEVNKFKEVIFRVFFNIGKYERYFITKFFYNLT